MTYAAFMEVTYYYLCSPLSSTFNWWSCCRPWGSMVTIWWSLVAAILC